MRYALLLCLLQFEVGLASTDDTEFKIINTDQGPVKGYKARHDNYFEFYGIPFATAPTGKDKFKAPLPGPKWTKVFEAVHKEIFCPQIVIAVLAPFYQENCLIINVWTPDTEETNLPVVAYTHGGGYNAGGSNILTPRTMVQQGNIIGVDFNYRVGPHGFLCLGTEDAPGNAGMKDLVAALRWVQRNIANFGGNPNDVTLAGQSAGSSAVDMLTLSDMTRGLYHKVIPESGMALSVWSVQKDPIHNAKKFVEKLNFTTDDINDLSRFYTNLTFDQLMPEDVLGNTDSAIDFVPCVEKDIGQEMFLKESPIEILKKGNFPKLPYLLGNGKMEGLMRSQIFSKWGEMMNSNFAQFLPGDLQFKNDEEKEAIAKKVKQFYFGDKPVNNDTIQGYVDYFSDVMFAHAAIKTARLQKEAGNDNIYLYEFSYIDDLLLQYNTYPHIRGATHCAQAAAVEDHLLMDALPSTEEYKKMRALTRKIWINFIKTGKPVPEPTDDFPEGWPAASADGSPWMDLNLPPKLHYTPLLAERISFWNEIYEGRYRIPIPPQSFGKHSEL